MKADDSVPPFFTESEFRTLHLFRAPPSSYNLLTKPNRPTLRVGRPQARRQNVRVLSRRRKFAKGRSVRVFRGCGFCRSNGTLLLLPALLLHTWATRGRGVDEVCPQATSPCALGCASGITLTRRQSGPHQQEAERAATWGRRPLLDGVGEVCPWRSDRALGCGPHSARSVTSPSRPPTHHSREAGARRRRRVPADASSRRRRRALARAGDGCCRLVVQSQGQRQWALLADNETAQALQHGCGDDCSRSASPAALHARPRALH